MAGTYNVMQAKKAEFAFTDDDFYQLATLVGERTGIVLAEHKRNMVYSRIARRLRALDLQSFVDYLTLLNSPGGEQEAIHFVNAITTNLTRFFREPHHFEHLREEVLVPLAKSPSSPKRLRIWSAGCSGGQEPYSIAMTIRETLPRLETWDAKILATDIDTNMLERGTEGVYDAEEMEHIPTDCRRKYVRKEGSSIHMNDSLKQLIHFKGLNLMEGWPMKGPFDIIFCRNVVIYFDKPTQTRLFGRMADLLKDGGWIYIGHSENLLKVCDRFELIGRTIYRKIV